jgi:thiol:disulfide interchange protein DsbA
LAAWLKKLPSYVAFKRVPVAFRPKPFEAHQRIFYALEALGQVEALHAKVFAAIHTDHQKLDNEEDIVAFMVKNGVDKSKFSGAYNSFGVQTKCRQAQQLAEAYNIDGVPTLGIEGRFTTSATLTGSNERALIVVDDLVERLHRGAL